MQHERRKTPRYVVDGLQAEIDGELREILDISESAVRLFRERPREACPATVMLHLWAEPGFPEVDIRCEATLVRTAPDAVVYGYAGGPEDWPRRLATFDSFQDLSLPLLEA